MPRYKLPVVRLKFEMWGGSVQTNWIKIGTTEGKKYNNIAVIILLVNAH